MHGSVCRLKEHTNGWEPQTDFKKWSLRWLNMKYDGSKTEGEHLEAGGRAWVME